MARLYAVKPLGDAAGSLDFARNDTKIAFARDDLVAYATTFGVAGPIAPPPSGKFYQGFYYDGVGTDTHDPTEHDVLPQDVDHYEKTVGAKTTWVYFSDNWFESREFPAATCSWIRDSWQNPLLATDVAVRCRSTACRESLYAR